MCERRLLAVGPLAPKPHVAPSPRSHSWLPTIALRNARKRQFCTSFSHPADDRAADTPDQNEELFVSPLSGPFHGRGFVKALSRGISHGCDSRFQGAFICFFVGFIDLEEVFIKD